MEETCTDFEVWSTRVEIFEGFDESPTVFSHEEGSDDAASTALTSNGMNEDAFTLSSCVFDEGEDFVENVVLLVEENLRRGDQWEREEDEYLSVVFDPRVGEIFDAD